MLRAFDVQKSLHLAHFLYPSFSLLQCSFRSVILCPPLSLGTRMASSEPARNKYIKKAPLKVQYRLYPIPQQNVYEQVRRWSEDVNMAHT